MIKKSPVYTQKSPVCTQKKTIYTHASPIYMQKSCDYIQKRPVNEERVATMSRSLTMIRLFYKRAL